MFTEEEILELICEEQFRGYHLGRPLPNETGIFAMPPFRADPRDLRLEDMLRSAETWKGRVVADAIEAAPRPRLRALYPLDAYWSRAKPPRR